MAVPSLLILLYNWERVNAADILRLLYVNTVYIVQHNKMIILMRRLFAKVHHTKVSALYTVCTS